ncbi:uncharacterized protein LOC124113558 [Haliotis rufescens]|uniref:uncharacterized protein LOC124113558 n=1 Tax=Haliotis rufescens TaxID=6454 RepID=UPI00201EE6DB|nr:uncharacterized protein LOC124113558 [Haliotis rufescens]
MRLSPIILVLLVCALLIPSGDGFWRRRRRRPRPPPPVVNTNTNRCHCGQTFAEILRVFQAFFAHKLPLGKRQVSTILDVDEDDPDLQDFMNLSKRDGLVDSGDLIEAVKRTAHSTRAVNSNTNHCQCGRMVLEHALTTI